MEDNTHSELGQRVQTVILTIRAILVSHESRYTNPAMVDCSTRLALKIGNKEITTLSLEMGLKLEKGERQERASFNLYLCPEWKWSLV